MQDLEQTTPEQRFYGTAVSRGLAVGRAVILNGDEARPDSMFRESVADPNEEIARLRSGLEKAFEQLRLLGASDASGIFEVHGLILEDAFGSGLEEEIRDQHISAETAIRSRARDLARRQRGVADSHIREKYLDIYDVAERLIRALDAYTESLPGDTGSIYIVSRLTPSRFAEIASRYPRAIISEHGGWTSHTSILAREYRLPAVSGIPELEQVIQDGAVLIVDGFTGTVVLNPSPETLASIEQQDARSRTIPITHEHETKTETSDGVAIVLRVNANLPEIYDRAHRAGANGIGLYRSEILFDKENSFPDEETQYRAYCEIASAVADETVRIRTFDLGVDRLPGDPRHHQRNPALGLRAVRYSLTEPEHFKTQVRAIMRASFGHNVDIVLPMISGVGDVLKLRRLIDGERESLECTSMPIGRPRVGVMIETPSAVMTAPDIAGYVDLFCLGTNDLVQYLLAVDRDDPSVADWYQTLHPAVLSSIRSVIEVGNSANIPVTVCGEMAGSPYYVPLLLGLGARELSMNVNSIAGVRALIADLDTAKCSELAEKVAEATTSEEAESILTKHYKQYWPFVLATTS